MGAQPVEVDATLTVFGAAPTRATVTLIPLSPGRRLARALGVLAACWAGAVVAVFIPVAHFLLVPALTIGGLVWAVLRFREQQRLLRVQGVCPRCGRAQEFVPGGTIERQPAVDCPGCLSRLRVTTGDPARPA
jgi:hypothetical protein